MDICWRPSALSVCRAGHRRRRQGRPEDCEDRAAIEGGPVMAQAFAEQLGHRAGRRNRGGFARPCLGSAAPALCARALSRSDADPAALDVLLCGALGHRVRFQRGGGPGMGRPLGSRLCGIPLHARDGMRVAGNRARHLRLRRWPRLHRRQRRTGLPGDQVHRATARS